MGGERLERAILVGPRIVSVFEKGDEKLKTACRGTGREIVSRRFLSKPSPRRRMGLLMRLCRGKFIGFALDHILPLSPSLPPSFSKISRGKWKIGKSKELNSSVPCIEGLLDVISGRERDWISKQKRLAGNGDRSIDRSGIPFFARGPPLSNQPFSRTERCQESLRPSALRLTMTPSREIGRAIRSS